MKARLLYFGWVELSLYLSVHQMPMSIHCRNQFRLQMTPRHRRESLCCPSRDSPLAWLPLASDPDRKLLKEVGEQTASQSTYPEDPALSRIFQSPEAHHSEEAENTWLSKMVNVLSLWEGMYGQRDLWIPLSGAQKGGLIIRKIGLELKLHLHRKHIFLIWVYVYLQGLWGKCTIACSQSHLLVAALCVHVCVHMCVHMCMCVFNDFVVLPKSWYVVGLGNNRSIHTLLGGVIESLHLFHK